MKPMTMLLENGANVDRCNVSGTAPLFLACSNGDEEAVKVLVEHGAGRESEEEADGRDAVARCRSSGCFRRLSLLTVPRGRREHRRRKRCDAFAGRRRTRGACTEFSATDS